MAARGQSLSDRPAVAGVPFPVRIGVSGHRRLDNLELLRRSIDDVLSRVDAIFGSMPHCYIVVSPLAEGADRLVAQQVLARPASAPDLAPRLEAVLPLPVEEYLKDFASEASRTEFLTLIARDSRSKQMSATEPRPVAYLRAGKLVVQSCDVLVAIWDGESAVGVGGVAEIVRFARHIGRWMFWISAKDGVIKEENRPSTLADSIQCLASYNRERVRQERLARVLASRSEALREEVRTAGLECNCIEPVCSYLLAHYTRASLLADHYQRRYNVAIFGVSSLAVLAVASVTIQVLFFNLVPQLAWIEVVALVLILSLLYLSRRLQWHRRWIDYRFLAERLRAALYLSICGLECSPPKPLPHSVAHRPDDWMVKAFAWIWSARPSTGDHPSPPFEPLKKFLLAAWIADQATFYGKRSRQYHKAQVRLTGAGSVLFVITLAVALIHVIGKEQAPIDEISILSRLLVSSAIILPALGAALADIRIHREYNRNAERYAHMEHLLKSLEQQIGGTADMSELKPLLEEANEVMLREQQDWRVVVLFQELEAP